MAHKQVVSGGPAPITFDRTRHICRACGRTPVVSPVHGQPGVYHIEICGWLETVYRQPPAFDCGATLAGSKPITRWWCDDCLRQLTEPSRAPNGPAFFILSKPFVTGEE